MSRARTHRIYLSAPQAGSRPLLVRRVLPPPARPAEATPILAAAAPERRALWVLWALGEALGCLLGFDALALWEL